MPFKVDCSLVDIQNQSSWSFHMKLIFLKGDSSLGSGLYLTHESILQILKLSLKMVLEVLGGAWNFGWLC